MSFLRADGPLIRFCCHTGFPKEPHAPTCPRRMAAEPSVPGVDDPNRCTICGGISLIGALGARVHALRPAEPHNVVLQSEEADRG